MLSMKTLYHRSYAIRPPCHCNFFTFSATQERAPAWSLSRLELETKSQLASLKHVQRRHCIGSASLKKTNSQRLPACWKHFLIRFCEIGHAGAYGGMSRTRQSTAPSADIQETTQEQEYRISPIGSGKFGQRQYTSSADDPPNYVSPKTSKKIPSNLEYLYQKFELEGNNEYEEAWRQYTKLDERQQNFLRRQLMTYLATSTKRIDAERITELFKGLEREGVETKTFLENQGMEKSQLDVEAYTQTIRSYLEIQNLSDAMKIFEDGCETLDYPAGCAELLAYFLKRSSWEEARVVWNIAQELIRARGLNYDAFGIITGNPRLGIIALELSKYVEQNASSYDTDPRTGLAAFSVRIVHQAVLKSVNMEPSQARELMVYLMDQTKSVKHKTAHIVEECALKFLNRDDSKLAIFCYRKARVIEGVKLSRPFLTTMLRVFCQFHSIYGMQQVMDDFFKHFREAPPVAYKLCLNEFSAQGDASTVHALWEQYTNHFAKKKGRGMFYFNRPEELVPILNVHARRGEIAEVEDWFNRIEDVYRMKPNIMCWNILLSAYAKVQDIDAAFDCFEKVLANPYVKADGYTFGTMMGICAVRGDLERALQLYVLAEDYSIEKNTAMVNCLVLLHIQELDIVQAEKICEDALGMKLKGSRARMWNYILIGYALQRDLDNVNRVLKRMSEAEVEYDRYTYSALMQALAMAKQTDRAYAILKDVLPVVSFPPTNFDYAVIMGGYILTGEAHRVFDVMRRMIRTGRFRSASTNLLTLKAEVDAEMQVWERDGIEPTLQSATKLFRAVIDSCDAQEISGTPQKGGGKEPLDIMYPTMMFNYMISVLAQTGRTEAADLLYDEFVSKTEQSRIQKMPVSVLSSFMTSKFRQADDAAVQECWDIILVRTLNFSKQLPTTKSLSSIAKGSSSTPQLVVPSHQLDLMRPLSIYLKFLFDQKRVDDMIKTIDFLVDSGFYIDSYSWNLYTEFLIRSRRYKLAFRICETRLIDNWTGWKVARWSAPVRNALPIEIRKKRQDPRYLRPFHTTLLYLARAYIDLSAMSVEPGPGRDVLDEIKKYCPKIVAAIQEMPRSNDALEQEILSGSD